MATRNGKIANLPNDIREQLNLRLLEGEPGRALAAWLNALPEVQSVLGSQFNGSPISEVNLTHWRQGGYLQWLTERECFDSARALGDAECDLAKIGFSAERLLNVLTVRFGQLLMRWDLPPDEGVSESAAFSVMARKARILQGISRAVLAIHRIQSRSALAKIETAISSEPSGRGALRQAQGLEPLGELWALSLSKRQAKCVETAGGGKEKGEPPNSGAALNASSSASYRAQANGECVTADTKKTRCAVENPTPNPFRAPRCPSDGHSKILSGPLVPPNLPHTLFKAGLDLGEILKAV